MGNCQNFTMKSMKDMKGRRRNTFSERTGTNLPRKTRCMRIRKPADLSSESCPSRGLIRSVVSCGATSGSLPRSFRKEVCGAMSAALRLLPVRSDSVSKPFRLFVPFFLRAHLQDRPKRRDRRPCIQRLTGMESDSILGTLIRGLKPCGPRQEVGTLRRGFPTNSKDGALPRQRNPWVGQIRGACPLHTRPQSS